MRQTLIRAYFSPLHTTGQRYIYAGGMDGSVRMYVVPSAPTCWDPCISQCSYLFTQVLSHPAFDCRWDIVTGEMVQRLSHHTTLGRDCSWHPYEPHLTTVSWWVTAGG